MVGTWFLQPRRPFTSPTENRRRQSDKCENLGKKADPPTRPIACQNASCAYKCRLAWRQQHCKKSILRQRICVAQARCATKAVSQTNGSDEDFNGVGRNEPRNRGNRHAYVQIEENKTCQGQEDEGWPKSCPYQRQHSCQNRAIWEQRPHRLQIPH